MYIYWDNEVDAVPQDSVEGLRGYLSDSLRRSDSIYTAEGDLPSEAPVNTLRELTRLVNIERGRAVAGMFTLKGTSRTCEVKLGCEVLVKMPESAPIGRKEVEEFQIVSVVHEVDERGYYRNSFTGVLSKLPAVPMSPVAAPRTGVQQGTVYRNDDPLGKGRVQVQLQWQKGLGKTTNWLRVQTPDAGSSDKVESNRGFVCIPEVGDTVVVGFDFGDPNRPFVMGSLFSEVTGAGGGEGNKGKSITSRSGCAMMLDDAKGSMTLRDQGGAVMNFDGSGNAAIEMRKEYLINAGDNITINVGSKEGGVAVIQADNQGNITMKGDKAITMMVGSSKIEMGGGKVSISADEISIAGKSIQLNGKGAWQGGDIKIN
ncbi:phage baseplate assembly protein V [Bacteroides congonensis]